MATVTKARITARKGVLSTLPTLLPGELGLATDVQKIFMGMTPVEGSKGTCTTTEWQYEFTLGNTPVTESFMELLDEVTYSIIIKPHDSTPDIVLTDSVISFEDEIVKINVDGLFGASNNRVPHANDKVCFYYNRELDTFLAESYANVTKEVIFAKSQSAGTPEKIADSQILTAGQFKTGVEYEIVTTGTTNFTTIGAADNNVGTKFTATGVGTGTGTAMPTRSKELAFLINNKNSITLDYTLSVTTGFRHGTLKILIDESGSATNSSIKDEYDITNGTVPVIFSLVADGDKWNLAFDTTDVVNSHTFKYIQKSFK